MAFPGNGVAPNICRREYMAEHFCDHKYKPNTNTCVFGGTFLLFQFLLQRSPAEESQPKHWMRTQKTQNNNINKRRHDTKTSLPVYSLQNT